MCTSLPMRTATDTLAIEIEAAVQLIVAATQRAAVAAIQEAFKGSRRPEVPSVLKREQPTGQRGGSDTVRRRSTEEINKLAQDLYDSVCAKPGETMAVLAQEMGTAPRLLQPAVARLKAEGRIRAVGHRHLTRYFPLPQVDREATATETQAAA